MNHNTSFKTRFEQVIGKVQCPTVDPLQDLYTLLERDNIDQDTRPPAPVWEDYEYFSRMAESLAYDGVSEKEIIQAILDCVVENIEMMVDTVDLMHLLVAQRTIPSLADAIPFELAEQVGYTVEEWERVCMLHDDSITAILEDAINRASEEHINSL